MSEVPTARHLFERFQDCAVRKDWQAFGDLFAEDGTMEFPFLPPEVASRYEGRAAIRAKARQAWGHHRFSGRRSAAWWPRRGPTRASSSRSTRCGGRSRHPTSPSASLRRSSYVPAPASLCRCASTWTPLPS